MQVFGNVATAPVRKISKTTQKGYFEFRLSENHAGGKTTSWYTVRVMRDTDPQLVKGDFVKVTGEQKIDSYLSRDGKPASTAVVLAFEAVKIKGKAELAAAREANKEEAKQ